MWEFCNLPGMQLAVKTCLVWARIAPHYVTWRVGGRCHQVISGGHRRHFVLDWRAHNRRVDDIENDIENDTENAPVRSLCEILVRISADST